MPVYHFNVYDGRLSPDNDGIELPDLEAARREALVLTGQLLKDDRGDFWEGDSWRLDVTNAEGLVLLRLMILAVETSAPFRRDRRVICGSETRYTTKEI